MYEFTHRKANVASIALRKPVSGVGINDADYMVCPIVDGKQVTCPVYRVWAHMIERCYSSKLQEKRPKYIGCSVAEEWLLFSNFSKWMLDQDWEGKELDKDLLVDGNKLYSAETCLFVTSQINSLFNDRGAARGKWPIGVTFEQGRFLAQCMIYGKRHIIGGFETPEAAYVAYISVKSVHVLDVARKQAEPLRSALIRKADLIMGRKVSTTLKSI